MSDSYNYNDPDQWSNAAPDDDEKAPDYSGVKESVDGDVAEGDDVGYNTADTNEQPTPTTADDASDSEQDDDALTPAQADEFESNDDGANVPEDLEAPDEPQEWEPDPFGTEPVRPDPVPDANPNPSYEEREPINATFVETRHIPNESVDESVERVTDDRIDPVTGRLADESETDQGDESESEDEAPF